MCAYVIKDRWGNAIVRVENADPKTALGCARRLISDLYRNAGRVPGLFEADPDYIAEPILQA